MNRFEKYLPYLEKALIHLDEWRTSFGEEESESPDYRDETENILELLGERLTTSYPFHHPAYAGHMIKPPHPVAWLAYSIAMTINPNNHALDGGPVTSEMEKEVIHELAGMVGYSDHYLGHLSSGGTIANLEALWISRELHPDKLIASTPQSHYIHERLCQVLKAGHLTVPVDETGYPDRDYLNKFAEKIGTIVVTLGTTGHGRVEPLHDFLDWAGEHDIRVHVDAAYGGFFKLIAGTSGIDPAPWSRLHEADSIVIDPHKHGLQPYGCGSVLFRDPSVGRFYKHDSPYTYFTSEELHMGEISLECSRAGASAAALWTTLQLLPLTTDGLGAVLTQCRQAALDFTDQIISSSSYELYIPPDLDIVTFFPLTKRKSVQDVSKLSRTIVKEGMTDREQPVYLSLYTTDAELFVHHHPGYQIDSDTITLLRCVFIKPEHQGFTGEIMNRLEKTGINALKTL